MKNEKGCPDSLVNTFGHGIMQIKQLSGSLYISCSQKQIKNGR